MRTINGRNMSQIKEIFDGWYYSMFKDENVETKAKEKIKICFNCPVRDQNKCSGLLMSEVVRDFIYNNEIRIKGDIHKGCGCPISKKTRSSSQCPLGKF